MDLDDYRAASLSQWERSAAAWGRRSEQLQRSAAVISDWMIDAIAPGPGQVVLELAAGPGETGLLAARLVAPDGKVISSDFAEPMVAAARERARKLDVDNVEFRVLNAESLALDAASVDAILCRMGYMLVADPASALQESRRVLRPGGRLALSAWGEPAANPWVSLVGQAVREELDTPEPDLDAPGMFSFAPARKVDRLLENAGFADVRVEPLEYRINLASFEDWWELQLDLGRPLADLLENCSPEQRERIRTAARAASAPFANPDGGLSFPVRAVVASATA